MRGIVVGKVLGTAVDGDAAVWTFVSDVGWGLGGRGGIWVLVGGVVRGVVGLVVGMRAVCGLAEEGGATPDLGSGRVGEGMEKVVGLEEHALLLVRLLGGVGGEGYAIANWRGGGT